MTKSDAYQYVMKNIDLGLNSKPMRIAATILLVFALISGLRLYSEKNYLNAQIVDVQRQFEQKNRPLMLDVMSKCQGDLSNSNVIQGCLDDTRIQMVNSLKGKLIKTKLSLLLWFIIWGVVLGGYIFLFNKQRQFRAKELEESQQD